MAPALSIRALLLLLLDGACNALTLRAEQPARSLTIECGTKKTNVKEHADFIGAKVWANFCHKLDHKNAKTATVQNPHGDITLRFTPAEGVAAGENNCVTVFQSLASGCADETWTGPESSIHDDVHMFNSGKGAGECGTFSFSIAD